MFVVSDAGTKYFWVEPINKKNDVTCMNLSKTWFLAKISPNVVCLKMCLVQKLY